MDRKSIIILVLCFVAFFSWHWLVNKVYPPKPLPPGVTNTALNEITYTNQNTLSSNSLAPAPQPSPVRPPLVTDPSTPEQLLEVTNSDAHYTFTSYGGGLRQVELLHYPEAVSTRRDKQQTNRVATLNTPSAPPTLAIFDSNGPL